MTKPTAKAKVLKVHPSAFACRTLYIGPHTPADKWPVWCVYKTWRSPRPMGYSTSAKQAWANAAANLKRNLK